MTSALLVGGTGPSGPHLVAGLLERAVTPTLFHTGRHEVEDLPDVEHIHGNPFSQEGIEEVLGNRSFDLVIASYGRVRLIAAAAAGKCSQFISVSGTPIYEGFISPQLTDPAGLPARVSEDSPLVPAEGIPDAIYGVGAVRRTEDAVFSLHADGAFSATVFRYPSIYGPRNPHVWEWPSIKRVLDGRGFMVIPDGGLSIHYRLSGWNAAQSVLLAVDDPEEASGEAFNCADDDQYSLVQWHQMVLEHLDSDLELVSVPGDIPSPGWGLVVFRYDCSPHVIVDTSKIRRLLGYGDAVPAREGLGRTVDWLVEHRAESDSWSLIDPFDYDAEDRFIEAWSEGQRTTAEAGARYRELPPMPFPQTASGTGQSQ